MAGKREKGDGQGKALKGNGKGKNQNTDTCHFCGEPGHWKPDCRHKMRLAVSYVQIRPEQTPSASAVEVDSEDTEEHIDGTQGAGNW